jgi:hypothetical protein
MSHIQPSYEYRYKEDSSNIGVMDATEDDYNERVVSLSTEQFYGQPIRYNIANGHRLGWIGVTPPGVKQVNQEEHWMSKPTDEKGNSWYRNGYDPDSTRIIGIKGQVREGNWVSGNATKTNCADHYKAGKEDSKHSLKYTPNFAGVETVTQTTTDRTMEPRSNAWGKRGVSNSRSSHTIGIMRQSREGDWVSEHTSKPDRTDHKVAGDTDGERHIL